VNKKCTVFCKDYKKKCELITVYQMCSSNYESNMCCYLQRSLKKCVSLIKLNWMWYLNGESKMWWLLQRLLREVWVKVN